MKIFRKVFNFWLCRIPLKTWCEKKLKMLILSHVINNMMQTFFSIIESDNNYCGHS